MIRYRLLAIIAALALVLVSVGAQARAGGGFSFGSRGMRTFSAPPVTRTAPNPAAPIGRSFTQPGASSAIGQGAGVRPGFFGGGLFGGLAAGFLGAGLFGALFGHGFFGGMGGFASLLGLILQIALIVFVARLIMGWRQRRTVPAFAGPSSAAGHAFAGLGLAPTSEAPASTPLAIAKSDYDAFERLLGDVQAAYSAEDLGRLRSLVTPEMLSYFSEQLAGNAGRGLVNRVTDVKLEQGDLAEAWREGATDYATVAMRFALTDSMVERASGRNVEGGSPDEATELWTFMRTQGGNWLLAAIQQA
jgi:predicted lipid-binding transport protein (Tim44 family)